MKNFFKYVLATIIGIFGFMLIMGLAFFLFVGISSLFSSDKPTIHSGSILELKFEGSIMESSTEQEMGFVSFEEPSNLYYRDILQLIDKAKDDDKIKGISLNLFGIDAGTTQVEEIRNKLNDFKESGKFVYAYGNLLSQKAYYLSTVADSIFLNPTGNIELKGLASEVMFFKNFGDKYGVDFQVIRHGKYKSAVEPFIRDNLSEENREQLSTLLGDVWGNLSTQMAQSRKINLADFNISTDSLYAYLPENALQHQLIDVLAQESEYYDFLQKKMGVDSKEDLHLVSLEDYAPHLESKVHSDKIAIIYASGMIMTGNGDEGIQSETYKKLIQKLSKDDNIKGVVLRVNSGGGSANASDEILYEFQKLNENKPLVVSFGDVAASGGYYIAMAGRKIYAEPNTITGSIGVLGMIPSFEKMTHNIGINTDYVQTNANSIMYSPFVDLSEGTQHTLEQGVEATYNRFVDFVSKNRKKSFAQIDSLGQGRVWTGKRAYENGLIDELGSLEDAIAYCAKLAEIEEFQVSSYPKPKDQFEILIKQLKGIRSADDLLKEELGPQGYALYQKIQYFKNNRDILMYNSYEIRF